MKKKIDKWQMIFGR